MPDFKSRASVIYISIFKIKNLEDHAIQKHSRILVLNLLGKTELKGISMIEDEIINVNKKITRLRYEYEKYNQEEIKVLLDLLQYHLFLVHTYFNKSEFSYDELILKLKEKMDEEK